MKNFTTDLKRGELGEAQLDAFFGQYWAIQPATSAQQSQGIDRAFYDLHTRQFAFSVEYKFDARAGQTGNAFIELVSSDATGQLGWAFTCTADRLFYCVPANLLVYVLDPTRLRRLLPAWVRAYCKSLRAVPNQGRFQAYNTIGILVPLRELEAIAEQTISM